MNKNLKVISSLAMAGILAATGISTVSAATTKSLGVYRKVVEGKAIVPYVLEKASDKVDVKDLNNELGVTLSSGTVVKTGTTFNKAGEPHTVVVYGDVKDDGKVNVNDVTTLVDAVANGTKLDEFKKEAADVRHDGKVNVNDITTLVGYIANGDALNISLPSEEVTNTGYTLTVGTNNVINNQNVSSLKLVVGVENSKISDTATRLEFKVYDANGNLIKDTTALNNLAANSNKGETSVAAANIETTLGMKVDGTENGTYTFVLIDTAKKVELARTNVNVKYFAATPAKVAKVNAKRTSATTAELSLEGYGEGKIVSVDFSVKTGVDSSNPTSPVDVYSNPKTISNVNNKLTNKPLDYVFPDGPQVMKLVFTDEFGNKFTLDDVAVPEYGATVTEALAKVKAPVLKDVAVAEFTFLDQNDQAKSITGEAVLYDENGKVLDKADITSAASKVNFTSSMNKAGKYKVGVTVSGNGTSTANSTETISDVVEVKELNAITNIEFKVNKDTTKVITFEDSNKKELLDTTTAYTISFEELDGTNKYITSPTQPTTTLDATNHTYSITANFTANKIYRVTINAKAKTGQLEYVANTNPTVSDSFFYIDASTLLVDTTVDLKTDKSLSYEMQTPINVNGTDATYTAEVNKVLKDANGNDYTLDSNKEQKNAVVTTDNTGKKYLTIEGLAQDQRYVIKIIATVGNMTGESELIGYDAQNKSYADAPQTYKKAPQISGFKVVKGDLSVATDKAKAVAKTIFVDNGGSIVVNGDVEHPVTLNAGNTIHNNYSPEFNDVLGFAATLVENDKITVNDSKIILTLTEDKSASTAVTIPATTFEGKEIEVVGNGVNSDRAMTVTSGAKLSKLSIGGNGLILALTNSDADTKVYLNNGAEVTGANTYTLVKGATATINGITSNTTNADMSITTTGSKVLTVNAPKGDINTNLVFKNNNNGRYDVDDPATINFASNDQTSKIIGTVTITSENGSVVVGPTTGTSLDITKLNLSIDATNADVDITGFKDSATVNVTIETTKKENGVADNTVTAVLGKDKLDMLDKLTTKVADDDVVVLQKYAENENITLATNKTLSAADKKLMQEFIDSFGIDNENVTMTFDDISAGTVTITVAGNTKVDLSGFTTYSNK